MLALGLFIRSDAGIGGAPCPDVATDSDTADNGVVGVGASVVRVDVDAEPDENETVDGLSSVGRGGSGRNGLGAVGGLGTDPVVGTGPAVDWDGVGDADLDVCLESDWLSSGSENWDCEREGSKGSGRGVAVVVASEDPEPRLEPELEAWELEPLTGVGNARICPIAMSSSSSVWECSRSYSGVPAGERVVSERTDRSLRLPDGTHTTFSQQSFSLSHLDGWANADTGRCRPGTRLARQLSRELLDVLGAAEGDVGRGANK